MTNDDLLPARMINEWVYCPRLAILEHLHGEWAESAETEDGHRVHRRVDEARGAWPQPEDIEGTEVARALWLSAPDEGLTAKLDLVEAVDGTGLVRPVDYKRGSVPEVPEQAWEPERVQLAVQAMVLRANGYQVEEGVLWYAASRRRIRVPITFDLLERTRQAAAELRSALTEATLPPPLVDSPKCNGCSLAPICLPDELQLVQLGVTEDEPAEDRLHRRLVPARDDALPVHVQTQGARVGVSGHELVISVKSTELGRAPIPQTSQVSLYGNVQVTTQAMRALFDAGIPVAFYSRGGWFYGQSSGRVHGNVFVREAQFQARSDAGRTLDIVRRIVFAKLRNQRTLLRRNGEDHTAALDRLENSARSARVAENVDQARGFEGEGAAAYFGAFGSMLHPPGGDERVGTFDFNGRNRRPPRDPVNALLSLGYSILCREWTSVLQTVGLDPYAGFLHRPRHARPGLALDLMEEFRPIIADSVALKLINTGEIGPTHFVTRGGASNLTDSGRKHFFEAWERRMDELVTHPVFGYRISYRRVLEVQARLFGRYLLGEIQEYPAFLVR